jgi:hypothetical protein
MFHDWENFYFLMGSAGAGLIGLLFVVVTLTSGFERTQALRGSALYMTPTAIQFSVVLTVSAVAIVPGLPLWATAWLFGLIALVGLFYAVRTCLGIGRPIDATNPPHWSDLWMYGATPAIAYFGLAIAAIAVWVRADWAPFAMAAVLLALLLIGIRNAWDLITWIAPMRADGSTPPPGDPPK